MTAKRIPLTKIRGVGNKTADKLKEALDVERVGDLLELSKERLREVEGIGNKRAERILENADSFFEECESCGNRKLEGETCENCLSDLQDDLKKLRKDIEEIREELGLQGGDHLERTFQDVYESIKDEDVEEGKDLLETLKNDLAKAEELTDLVVEIEDKLDNGELIYDSAYENELDKIRTSFEKGKYGRGEKRAGKVLNYIENEEEYLEMDEEEILRENIEEFSRKVIGTGPRVGEKIYGNGYHTLKEVYEAGVDTLQRETEIKETTSRILIDKLTSLFERKSLDIESGQVEEKSEEEVDSFEEKEESIFRKVEETQETEEEKTKIQKIDKDEKKTKSPSPTEIYQRKNVQKIEKKDGIIDWIPAVVVTILLVIAGYLLFFHF